MCATCVKFDGAEIIDLVTLTLPPLPLALAFFFVEELLLAFAASGISTSTATMRSLRCSPYLARPMTFLCISPASPSSAKLKPMRQSCVHA